MGDIAYCSRCDKYVEPDLGFECPVCETTLRPEKEIPKAPPKAVTEPVMETEPEEPPEEVEAKVEDEAKAEEVEEMVDIEDLLSKG